MSRRIFILLVCMAVLSSAFASAAGGIVGVSPSTLSFKGVMRGGYAERPITVSYSSDSSVNINMSAEGDIASWLNFTKKFTVSKSQFARPIVSVSPPSDMPNGVYTGFIVISASLAGANSQEGRAVSQVISVLRLAITVEITDQEYVACTATDFLMDSAEKGDKIGLKLNVLNEGNIRLRPDVKIKIWNQDQTYVVKEIDLSGQEIFPTKEQTINFSLSSSDLDVSQYWASIEVPQCYASQTLTFDVLQPGALKSNLVLLRMYGSPVGQVNENLPVVIDYQNLGEKDVQAQFKGQVSMNGKITQILESDKFISPIRDKNNITLYFTPQNAGKYVVSGRIFYDNKRTFESSIAVTVSESSNWLNRIWAVAKPVLLVLLYAAIIAVIIFLLVKIRREKEEYQRKILSLRR